MALGTTNITTTLVGTTIGSASRDVGTLCSSTLINKWSKNKPISYPTLGGITDAQRKESNYGISIPEFSSIGALVTAIDASNTTWEYYKPQGGINSPYRIGDFRKYNHLATIPYSDFYVPKNSYNNNVNAVTPASIMAFIGTDEYSLTLTDFNAIKNWYFGAYMKKASDGSYARYITASYTIEEGAIDAKIPIYGLPDGQYYVYPFICKNQRLSLADPEPYNLFVPLEGFSRRTVNIADSPINIFISALWRTNASNGIVDVELIITNNSPDSVALQYCNVSIRYKDNDFGDPLDIGESSQFLNTINVDGDSTVTQNLVFTVNNNYSTNGWKVWFSSTSPYNLIVGSNVMEPFI